jgi:hypothetical protein
VSVVVLCSAHGAPGVTTSALALAWVWPSTRPERRVLLIDADPAGSGLLTGILADRVGPGAGLPTLAATRPPLTVEPVVECCVALGSDAARMVLPGVADPVQARPVAELWSSLLYVARELSDRGVDVLVDAGRVGHRLEPTAWLRGADVVALVVKGSVASVAPAAAAVRAIVPERGARPVVGIVVDPAGYSTSDVASALGVPVAVDLPRDEWAVRALAAGATSGWRLDRSPLLRAARGVVQVLADLVPERTAVPS